MATPLRSPPDKRSVEELLSFGVVNLDKPPGPSAHQVAAWVRDLTDQDRAAHSGTLDPKVTGCLPILLGDATRAAQVFDKARKGYVSILELHGPIPAEFESVVAEFEGQILQKPPRKSAVSRRLRTRTIHSIEVLESHPRRALLYLTCESGTYVRKLCHDIGLALGTGAHMGDLRRVQTGTFDDTTLVTLHDLLDALVYAGVTTAETGIELDESQVRAVVEPAERALSHLPRLTMARSAALEVAEGAPLYAPGAIKCEACSHGDLVAGYTPNGAAVCIGRRVGDPANKSGVVLELERVLI
jgi:tRNA pseudouridine55 synthase